MTPVQITEDRLRAMLAATEGVTPGPWTSGAKHLARSEGFGNYEDIAQCIPGEYDTPRWETNARHIANCDPQTIAALVTEVLAAREVSRSRPAEAKAEQVAWQGPPPFITATSNGSESNYYVTVKVKDIKALHRAHDIALSAFKAAVDGAAASPTPPALTDRAGIIARAEAAEAEVAKLKEALKPFALAAEIKLCGEWRDEERCAQTDAAWHLTFGHLRRARETLKGTSP